MIKVNVLPADTYTLVSRVNLTDENRKVLTMLYQPIIGSVATNLYFTFWSNLDKKEELLEYNHYHLMISMGLSLDMIIEAREKLEGIGLIKTYVNSVKTTVKGFIYEMYAPLSPFEFISSPLLSILLMNNIGEDEYKKTVSLFKKNKVSLDNYQDITCSFQEIFKISDNNVLTNIESNIKKNVKNNIVLEQGMDIDSIISLIPDEMLNKNSVTKDIKNIINNLAFVYNLDEDSLKEIISNSIDTSHKIDKELLKINSRNFYDFHHSGRKPGVIYRKQPENLRNKSLENSNKMKMIHAFENTTPYDFLKSKYGNVSPTKTDLIVIEYLLTNLAFTPGVANVLIDYVLRINDNKLNKSYVEKIAGQWKRNNINTVEKAIELAKKEYQARKNKKNKMLKKIETTPEWMNQKIEPKIASKEEQEKISKMLKELVGEQ